MKTYKYKLQLTKKQENTCNSWVSTCRALYNVALNERIMVYEMRKKSVSKFDQYNQLPELKKQFPWFAEVYSDTIQEVLDRLDKTYQNFFRGFGFPKFAKKGEYKSFTFKRNITVAPEFIKLPKIGKVKYFNSREIIGTPKTATIIKESSNWFISITSEYETNVDDIVVDNSNAVGIDVGISVWATLSDGTTIETPLFLENNLNKLKLLNKKISRQKRGSNERVKTIAKLQKLHKKIANSRKDFLHKQSTIIANKYSACYVEDLKLQKMNTANSTLTRKMSDSGFGMFKILLQYKFKERGKHLGLVNPAYTSQTCNACGTVDKKSRLSQSEFVCATCGFIDNADANASKNIKSKGITQEAKRKTLV
jgi:putative transposase